MPPAPITPLEYASLTELYQHYIREYVDRSPIVACCGCQIHCYEHHFVHMVKLRDPGNPAFLFPDAKPTIINTAVGFGVYEHDELRARWLLAALESLRSPDMVVRPAHLDSSDRAFIKEFVHSQYPYAVVLVGKDEEGKLTLRTAFPMRRGRLKKWTAGDILFPRTPQPPVEVAV